MHYHVYVTVWGAPYVAKFLDYSLPSQLSPGNLPALARDARVTYTIYTDRQSRPLFDEASAAIEANADLRFRYFDDISYRGQTVADGMAGADPAIVKHNVQGVTARHLIDEAGAEDAAVILLDSDFIIADGAFARVHELRRGGIRAVTAIFLRLGEEDAGPGLKRMLAGGGIGARQLVGLGIEAMHPLGRSFFVDALDFTAYPSQLNWWAGRAGFVTHCFFPHPLMVVPGPAGGKYFSTMDYEFALRAVADDGAIHLARSSDEILICKMSALSYRPGGGRTGTPGIDGLARFIVNNTNIRHRNFMEQPVRFVAGGAEGDWAAAADSRKFVEAAYKMAELLISEMRAGDAKSLVFVKSFLGPIENFLSPQVYSRLRSWIPKETKGR